jgi:hypothetical protein
MQAHIHALLAAALIIIANPVLAQRTDELVLWNGNTITGEVKSLQQGKLKYKTDHAGTIYIEWEFVHSLTSLTFFDIETEQGVHYFGTLGASEDVHTLAVVGKDGSVILDMDEVVTIVPIQKTFWSRVDGSLNIGASFTSADSILQYSLESDATYFQQRYSAKVTVSSIQTRQENRDDTFRDSIDFTYTRYLKKRYFSVGTLGFNRSSELGLDLRTQIAYGYGRNFVQTNRSRLSATLGLAVSRDTPIGEEPNDYTLLGAFAGRYHFFLYNFPKTDILIDLVVLPGITAWPRLRVDFNGSIKREIVTDFTVNFSVFDSYDSEPASEAAANHDFGIILSVGWTF